MFINFIEIEKKNAIKIQKFANILRIFNLYLIEN